MSSLREELEELRIKTVWQEQLPDSVNIHIRLGDDAIEQILSTIRKHLPEKKPIYGQYEAGNIVNPNNRGFNKAIDEVNKILEGKSE